METKFVMDLHTHTIVSGHAYGTIREMAHAASEAGLEVLGITEHGPGIPGTTAPIYFTCLGFVPRVLSGVTVLHGCEANVLDDGILSLEDSYMRALDYVIAGIHAEYCYTNVGREKNTDNLIRCMAHPKVRFVAHPDDDHTPLDYERLVLAAKEYNVALEINNSSLRKRVGKRINIRENYHTMLALCEKHGVFVFASSDAHDPSKVGNFSYVRQILAETNFNEELLLNTSVDKLKAFLGVTTFERKPEIPGWNAVQ